MPPDSPDLAPTLADMQKRLASFEQKLTEAKTVGDPGVASLEKKVADLEAKIEAAKKEEPKPDAKDRRAEVAKDESGWWGW
jgi:hypothetical protein